MCWTDWSSVAELDQPGTLRAQRPTSSQSGQSNVAEVDQPGTLQAQRPTSSQSGQSNVAEVDQPGTLQAQRPTSPQSSQSSVAEVDQPGTSQAQSPMLLQSSQSTAARKLVTSISPLPKAEKSRARKRRVEAAEVLTGSPYKKMLVERMSKTKKPERRREVHTYKSKKSNDLVPKRKKKLTCREDKRRGRPKQQRPTDVSEKKSANNKATSQRKRAAAGKEKKSGDTRSPSKCHGCGIMEFSREDLQMNKDWIACKSCGIWFHDSCGEEHGLFDDEYFYCINCVD